MEQAKIKFTQVTASALVKNQIYFYTKNIKEPLIFSHANEKDDSIYFLPCNPESQWSINPLTGFTCFFYTLLGIENIFYSVELI